MVTADILVSHYQLHTYDQALLPKDIITMVQFEVVESSNNL